MRAQRRSFSPGRLNPPAGPSMRASASLLVQSSCASHTAAGSSYWRLYAVVYITNEEEMTSDGVQMRSASTVLLSLSSCKSEHAPAGRLLEQLLRESSTVDALHICTPSLAVSSSFDMYTTTYNRQ